MASVVNSLLGTLLDTTLVVENGGTQPVTILLVGELRYPDGTLQRLRNGQPMPIARDGAVILLEPSAVLSSVEFGAGIFLATASVTAIGSGGRHSFRG